jgi:hypothetical protein
MYRSGGATWRTPHDDGDDAGSMNLDCGKKAVRLLCGLWLSGDAEWSRLLQFVMPSEAMEPSGTGNPAAWNITIERLTKCHAVTSRLGVIASLNIVHAQPMHCITFQSFV